MLTKTDLDRLTDQQARDHLALLCRMVTGWAYRLRARSPRPRLRRLSTEMIELSSAIARRLGVTLDLREEEPPC
jgi:hypothetical protein